MRSVSGRQELTSEWFRRGVRESDEFRALTNEMMQAAFGLDVESYRRYKGLFRTGANLRDHMTELELALTALSESTAVELARQRRSNGFDALLLDAKETGQIIAKTRAAIEERTGRRVVSAVNHLPMGGPRPPRRPGAQGRLERWIRSARTRSRRRNARRNGRGVPGEPQKTPNDPTAKKGLNHSCGAS